MKLSGKPVLELKNVTRHFEQGGKRLDVLKGVNLTVWPGEMIALVGPSGAGKSTLLHTAGLLERADAGDIIIEGVGSADLSDRELTRLRRDKIGFIYQFHHLLPEFSALENVVLPQLIASKMRAQARHRATSLLSQLGLAERLTHQPMQLSGGEQQRVAIARALANKPVILLADEPTGNLDRKTSASVFSNLVSLARDEGLAAVIATHNLDLAREMDRVVLLHEGKLIDGKDLLMKS